MSEKRRNDMFERCCISSVVAEQASQRHQRHVAKLEQARFGAVEHQCGGISKNVVGLIVYIARDEFAGRVERRVDADHREQGVLARAVGECLERLHV